MNQKEHFQNVQNGHACFEIFNNFIFVGFYIILYHQQK